MTHIKYDINELRTVARTIADMRYDDMSYLLGTLADMLAIDADKDRAKQRVKLAKICESASVEISQASMELEAAWTLSKKHMGEQ